MEIQNVRMPMQISLSVVVAMVLPNIGGWLGAVITSKNINWYEAQKRPKWTPPNWVYGPVWTAIYCATGYASHLVLRDSGGWEKAALPLSIYGVIIWSSTGLGPLCSLALYDKYALWCVTVAMAVAFHRINATAGLLILPYIAWNTLVTILNGVMYRDNELKSSATTDVDKKK